MLTPRALERAREILDTLMATVRPSLSGRERIDFSYRLTEDLFLLFQHLGGETGRMTPHAFFKAVHVDTPDSWLLYVPDAEGHWQLHSPQPQAVLLEEALDAAEALIAGIEPPAPLLAVS